MEIDSLNGRGHPPMWLGRQRAEHIDGSLGQFEPIVEQEKVEGLGTRIESNRARSKVSTVPSWSSGSWSTTTRSSSPELVLLWNPRLLARAALTSVEVSPMPLARCAASRSVSR